MKEFFTILGGMGTLATESFVHVLNQRTPIKKDQDYLDYVVVNHASIPDRTAWILNHEESNYNLDLIEDIKQQSKLNPNFFVLACNTAHYSYDTLQATTNIPILNMPKETVNQLKQSNPEAKRVGVLATRGTITAGIYDQHIKDAGYEVVRPNADVLEMTEDLIYHDIKEKGQSNNQKYHNLVKKMFEEQKTDIVILGCTELSYADEISPETNYPIIDAQAVIVDKTIKLSNSK